MTRSHRQRHRLAWLVLGVVLPVLLAAGLLLRREPPVMPGDAFPAANPPVQR